MSNSSEFDHGTEHRAKKRHKMEKYTTRGGTNIHCVHCDTPVSVTQTEKRKDPKTGEIVEKNVEKNMWHYTDKTGMKAAWEAHKAENQ